MMPLARDSNGRLGVRAEGGDSKTVVIVNNNVGGSEVTKTERTGSNGENIIEVFINSVKNALIKDVGENGDFASALQGQYGVNRANGAWR